MARKQSGEQKEIVGRVMHEFKHGELEAGGGRKVRNPKQAIAIALSEAGSSNQQSPKQNKHALQHTRAKERTGQTGKARAEGGGRGNGGSSKAELYEQAKRAGIEGRSKMSKDALQKALASNRS